MGLSAVTKNTLSSTLTIYLSEANSSENISAAVQQFVSSLNPLVLALQVTSFETQISVAEDPLDLLSAQPD